MSLNSLDNTWCIPGLPFAVGGPSRNVNVDSSFLRDSMDLGKVPSSFHFFIRELSSITGSKPPGETGTLIGQATYVFVLNLRGAAHKEFTQ